MKSSVGAAFSAALIAMVGASSAAQAVMIDFGFSAEGGSITHDGSSLDKSSQLDLDESTMLVLHVEPGDASGLVVGDARRGSVDRLQVFAEWAIGHYRGGVHQYVEPRPLHSRTFDLGDDGAWLRRRMPKGAGGQEISVKRVEVGGPAG